MCRVGVANPQLSDTKVKDFNIYDPTAINWIHYTCFLGLAIPPHLMVHGTWINPAKWPTFMTQLSFSLHLWGLYPPNQRFEAQRQRQRHGPIY